MSNRHLGQPAELGKTGLTKHNEQKTKNKQERLKKDEIQYILVKTKQRKSAFSTIQLMDVLKNFQEEKLLIKYYLIKL